MFGKRGRSDGHDRSVDPDELQRSVDEGFLIARAALIVAIANVIIRNALERGADFATEDVAAAVREELERLADEQRTESRRMAELLTTAERQRGRSRHQHDYRRGDSLALRTREASYNALAHRLMDCTADTDFVEKVIVDARDRAWADVGSAVVDRLGWAQRPAPDYAVGRDERLRQLIDEDLAALGRQHDATD